ncbi:tRNA-2-methylthio-N(6)-dimethylallyladenosine synthase [subsurface metagenome]
MLQRSREQYFESEAAKDDFLFLNITNEPLVDLYIISRRGEHILCEALKKLKQNQAIDNLPNSAHLPGKSYSFTNQIDDTSNVLDNFIDWESLPDSIFESGVVPIQSSNGCPYKCAFCSFVKDRRLMFVKPMDELIDELKILSSRGVRYVWFVDENFRLGNSDLSSICQRFVDEDLNIKWMSYARASALKNIEAELLRRSGCIEVQLGLESADQQVLNSMNKQASSAIYAEVIQKLLAAGINCSCYFIFGFPGETDETVFRTIEFIKSIEYPNLEGILSWSIYPFMLAPMSPIYESEMRKKYGLTGYMHNWEHRTMNSVEAREHVKKTFFAIERSGPIYRGDNQKILHELMPMKRKQFMAKRHELSKLAMENRLEKHDVIKSFTDVFYQ